MADRGDGRRADRSGAVGPVEAVAGLAAAIRRSSVDALRPRRTSMSKQRLIQLAAASTVGVMTLFGGLAAANALPGAAQRVASDMLGKVGVSVPNPNSRRDAHPRQPWTVRFPHFRFNVLVDFVVLVEPGSGFRHLVARAYDHRHRRSEKGAAISSAASAGQSQAGQHGQPTTSPDTPTGTPPVGTPVGPPAGRPVGPPVSTPAGPPAGTPVGTPVGPPAGTPVGPPGSVPPVSVPGH